MQLSAEASRALLNLARGAISQAVTGTIAPAAVALPELQQHAGCFVSLHELHNHRLRGCVGRMESDRPLATLVPQMATGCLLDPRFTQHRVTPADLPRLEIEVTLLSPLHPIADPLDFDLLSDGLYLTIGDATGCFLPQVARETGWTKLQLLARLCEEKLSLPAEAWKRSDARLQIFRTLILGPEPLSVPRFPYKPQA